MTCYVFSDGREVATLRKALAEAHSTVVSLDARSSSDGHGTALLDGLEAQMEAQLKARLEAAVQERSADLRAQLSVVAADLEASKHKVLQAGRQLQLLAAPKASGSGVSRAVSLQVLIRSPQDMHGRLTPSAATLTAAVGRIWGGTCVECHG